VDLIEKLEILTDAAKYDVACTSSGIDRDAQKGKLGSTVAAGICHSFAADGRCITLLKVLQTNVCVYDCVYCVNRCSNEIARAAFKPRELADLTIGFYRRNYIEGLFLSSGVIASPDYTTELMVETLRILRDEYQFRGYIHAKAVPGASPELVGVLGHLADRMSVNMELPSQDSLRLLAPEKSKQDILRPMRQIKDSIAEDKDTRALMKRGTHYLYAKRPAKKSRAFVPAGQSTQMIVGASPESDYHILRLSASLYQNLALKRVFFSAYLPVNHDARLPAGDAVQLDREHRLYQADWLLRFYEFDVDEIITPEHPFLDPALDPKANWALNNLDSFPVEVNTAPYEMLLRVPGIGVRGAKLILRARRSATLREGEIRKLGVAYKRARFFITCNGSYAGTGVGLSREGLRAQLAAPIQGGRHGRRADRALPGQMSLFESAGAPTSRLFGSGRAPALAPAAAAAGAGGGDLDGEERCTGRIAGQARNDGVGGLGAAGWDSGTTQAGLWVKPAMTVEA
jgi:putative DNA modification/repair radical SAM protein